MGKLPEVRSEAFQYGMAGWGVEKTEFVLQAASKALSVARNRDLKDDAVREQLQRQLSRVVEYGMRLLTFFSGIQFTSDQVQAVLDLGFEGFEGVERKVGLIEETEHERALRGYLNDPEQAFSAFTIEILGLLDGPPSNRTLIHQLLREHRMKDSRFRIIDDLTEELTMGNLSWTAYKATVQELVARHSGGDA